MWVGFSPDMAEPSSSDPVKKQSSKLQVLGRSTGKQLRSARDYQTGG